MQTQELVRQQRGEEIAQRFNLTKTSNGWKVPSQSKNGYYNVDMGKQECDCPDCKYRNEKCKHIYAVEFFMEQKINAQGNVETTKGIKVTYSQEWRAYNKAQTNEKLLFLKLLNDLTNYAQQPNYKFGRPTLPLSDMVFSAVFKVYSTFSARRFMSDMKLAYQLGYLSKVPHYNSIFNYLQKEDLTPVLKELVKISALPLKSVESSFTVDSSGFSTSRFARYFDYKHKKNLKYRIWIKAHLMSGTKTNIVTSCEITEGQRNDSRELPNLLKQTAEHFDMKEVCGDKAYLSRQNLHLINQVGAVPYIPFKKNTTSKPKTYGIWKKMFYYFKYNQEEFMEHYHKRSNSETVFHMIKTKFGDSISSRDKTAQVNELLCKVLAHNICVIIQEMMELGIKGEFVADEKLNIRENLGGN